MYIFVGNGNDTTPRISIFYVITVHFLILLIGIRSMSFLHRSSSYQVETRARVIMFDITAFEANRALQRRSSSLISHSIDRPPRTLSKEHNDLMSWPELSYKPRQPLQPPKEETNQQANNLSIRAMQLSIFGSTVYFSLLLWLRLTSLDDFSLIEQSKRCHMFFL